ncbi:MAG: hypothetical protein CM15mP112_09680 [Flavobacteriales bacterium]|nr:MAG: hypothetical protein CM15mP112_09680 [Flavobacteriales bacterium]
MLLLVLTIMYVFLPSNLTTDRQVRAIEVVPGNPQIVHHVLVSVDELGISNPISTNCMAPAGNQVTLMHQVLFH